MTASTSAYLGRMEERQIAEKYLTAPKGQTCLLYIVGIGGSGKTAFLELVRDTYARQAATQATPARVVPVVDFDDLTLRIRDNFMARIGELVDAAGAAPEAFEAFWREWRSQYRAALALKQSFFEGLRHLTAQARLVLMLDTLEKAPPIWFPDFLNELAAVPNLTLIIVGRPESQKVLPAGLLTPSADKSVYDRQWEGLDPSLCQAYFTKDEFRDLQRELTWLGVRPEAIPELEAKLWELARGIPFQVNLFVSLLLGLHQDPDGQMRLQMADLLQQIQAAEPEDAFDLREHFKVALTTPFVKQYRLAEDLPAQSLTRTVARILLLIAHVNHYMAQSGGLEVGVLATLDETLTPAAIENAIAYIIAHRDTQFTYVKLFRNPATQQTSVGLHDEMTRMLNEAAWLKLDPPLGAGRGNVRRAISAKLVSYYDQLSAALAADKTAAAEAARWARAVKDPAGQGALLARVMHSIYNDFLSGWAWIYELSRAIFNRTDFDIQLCQTIEKYIEDNRFPIDADMRARLDVLRANVHIVSGEYGPARALLEKSGAFWAAKYAAQEHEAERLEKQLDLLARFRRAASDELREEVPTLTAGIADAQAKLKALPHLEDLERVYLTLGFCYRNEGEWDQAIAQYHQALKFAQRRGNLEGTANLANNIANVDMFMGRLTQAALYSQISILIRKRLGQNQALGNSYRILAMINWQLGNNYECRRYLHHARECYQGDEQLNALVDLYEGYTYSRIGDTDISHASLAQLPDLSRHLVVKSYLLLLKAAAVFENHGNRENLSWAWNMLSRAYRRDDRLAQAEEAALKALDLAQKNALEPMRPAEAHLSLCMLYFRRGRNAADPAVQAQQFEAVEKHYAEGLEAARKYVSIWSMYEGVRGNMAYASGDYATAFDHYFTECTLAARNRELRFERALNEVIADRLAKLPFESALDFADSLLARAEAWRTGDLAPEYAILKSELEETKQFLGLPEKERIEKAVAEFNRRMHSGDYDAALKIALTSFQHVSRYTWRAENISFLLKTAQAYRKTADYSSARRHCKQALLILDQLSPSASAPEADELRDLRAEANFTMGRILWEIGNTAEAATHFRYVRVAYLGEAQPGASPVELTWEAYRALPRLAQELLARNVQYEGFMRFRVGDFDQALDLLEWAEREYTRLNSRRHLAKLLNLKARIYRDRNQPDDDERAYAALNQARPMAEAEGDHYGLAECCLTAMILEYQQSLQAEATGHRQVARAWYDQGLPLTGQYHYVLLRAVYEGILGNILFDETLAAAPATKPDFRPAIDQYLKECWWDAHFERRRFFRSLDFLMRQLSKLSGDEMRYYVAYIRQTWKDGLQAGQLFGATARPVPWEKPIAPEYAEAMDTFCNLVEDFSEYLSAATAVAQ